LPRKKGGKASEHGASWRRRGSYVAKAKAEAIINAETKSSVYNGKAIVR
jgi:hypothetical protein